MGLVFPVEADLGSREPENVGVLGPQRRRCVGGVAEELLGQVDADVPPVDLMFDHLVRHEVLKSVMVNPGFSRQAASSERQ